MIADFTGDSKPDVVTANYGGSSISLLRHNGLTGNSAGFLAPVTFSTGNHAEKIAAADVNGNGILDVVVGEQVGIGFRRTLAVMINTGNGNFAAPILTMRLLAGVSVRPQSRWPISITTATSI